MNSSQNPLQAIIAAAESASDSHPKKLPPVHLWEPDYCGDIGLRIARDGQWYYDNSPIGRKKLVQLFSTILRHDDDGEYYLVTPVEKIRIEVEDTPFIATLVHREKQDEGEAQRLVFETNVGDHALAGNQHPMRFVLEKDGTAVPYIHIRARLEARIARSVFYELVSFAVHHGGQFGVWSDGVFFPMIESARLKAQAR